MISVLKINPSLVLQVLPGGGDELNVRKMVKLTKLIPLFYAKAYEVLSFESDFYRFIQCYGSGSARIQILEKLNPDLVPDSKIKVLDPDPCLDPELKVSNPDFDPYQDLGTDPVLEVSDPGPEPEVPDPIPDGGPDQEIKVSDPDPELKLPIIKIDENACFYLF
jgi:hypothetical protein